MRPKRSMDEFSLTPLARVDLYRGLIFASVAADGISLAEHLGPVAEFIDLFMDLSPEGRISLAAGSQKGEICRQLEIHAGKLHGGDYHGPFIHKIASTLHARRSGLDVSSLHENEIPDVIRSLPGGHMVEDYRGAPLPPRKGEPSPARKAYAESLKQRYGEAKAKALLGTIAPLVYVFPNLIYMMTHLRVVQPVSAGQTYTYYYPVMLEGAPDEVNEGRLRDHEFMMGPAGFISPDDIEIMERNHHAMNATGDDWLFIGRGLHRERSMPDGGRSGMTMDETHLRGFWRHYAQLMDAPDA